MKECILTINYGKLKRNIVYKINSEGKDYVCINGYHVPKHLITFNTGSRCHDSELRDYEDFV